MIPFVKETRGLDNTMDTTTTDTQRGIRADARRNRERIIEGARAEFARCGALAQMEDIARTSGVGVGTVYRHFPTKEALMTELVRRNFAYFAETAEDALADDREPFLVLADVLRRCAGFAAADASLQRALTGAGDDEILERVAAERERLREATGTLVERAQQAGTMRLDASGDDVGMMMCGVCATMGRKLPGFDWHRHLELMIDGLRRR
jgi:AcrR family transcriptional regulator